MPNLEDVKKALEAIDGGSELYEAVTLKISDTEKKIAEEKKKGIAASKEKNKEAEGLRKYKKTLEAVGFKVEDDDLDDFEGKLKTALEKDPKKEVKGSDEYKEVVAQMSKMSKNFDKQSKELEKEKKEKDELAVKTQRTTMKSVLFKALDSKVWGANDAVDNLISKGEVKMVEDVVVFVDKDEEIEFDDGIKSFLEKRTDILKNDQTPGAGSSGGGGSSKKNLDEEQKSLDRLRAQQKGRAFH